MAFSRGQDVRNQGSGPAVARRSRHQDGRADAGYRSEDGRRYVRAAEEAALNRADGADGLDDEGFMAVLALLKTPPRRAESDGRRLCEEQRESIESKLGQRVRLAKIHRLLIRQGVVVSYSTLYRFAVEELGFGRNAATVPVVNGEPGEELQLDVGNIVLPARLVTFAM